MTTTRSKWRSTLTPDWARMEMEGRKSKIFRRVGGIETFDRSLFEYIRPTQQFITGSSYSGFWDSLGFSGQGTYVYPHGAVYQGTFKDGQFHGRGTILYPRGHKLKGLWDNGKLIDKIFVFGDGLKVDDPWNYCQMPDRRFQTEFNLTLRGAGREFLTNKQPTVDIPKGCYDTIDGFFNPELQCVYRYDKEDIEKGEIPQNKEYAHTFKRICQQDESSTIEKFYRKAELGSVGYRADLYENWTTGIKTEIENIKAEHQVREEIKKKEQEIIEKGKQSLTKLNKIVEVEFRPDPNVTQVYQEL